MNVKSFNHCRLDTGRRDFRWYCREEPGKRLSQRAAVKDWNGKHTFCLGALDIQNPSGSVSSERPVQSASFRCVEKHREPCSAFLQRCAAQLSPAISPGRPGIPTPTQSASPSWQRVVGAQSRHRTRDARSHGRSWRKGKKERWRNQVTTRCTWDET